MCPKNHKLHILMLCPALFFLDLSDVTKGKARIHFFNEIIMFSHVKIIRQRNSIRDAIMKLF